MPSLSHVSLAFASGLPHESIEKAISSYTKPSAPPAVLAY